MSAMSQGDEAHEMRRVRKRLVLWSSMPERRLEKAQGVLRKEMKSCDIFYFGNRFLDSWRVLRAGDRDEEGAG